jgi:hypothetical protein
MRFHDDELAELACGDGGCIIQRPQGMHTNGGCHCLDSIRNPGDRVAIRKAMLRYREIVSVLAAAKLVKDNNA